MIIGDEELDLSLTAGKVGNFCLFLEEEESD